MLIRQHDYAQVCLRLATIKGHSKCAVLSHSTMPQMSKFWGSVQLACWLQECPPELLPVNWMFIFSTISLLQRRFREFGSTSSQPQTTCNHTTQDLYIQHLHLQDRLKPATRTPAATIGLHNQRISAQTVRNRLREAHLHARRTHRGLDLTAVHRRNRLEWANAHIQWRLALWRGVFFTDESRFSLYRADGRQRVWRSVGLLKSTLWIEGPLWRWGYCMGRRMLWTTNTGAFYWWHFECTEITVTRSWGPLLCHSSMTITSCCSMIMHGPMLQGSVHNSWKLKTSQFLHGQHTHRTCHPLSMFGMLWIGVYDSVFQFLPISSNFAQPLKRSGPTFHRPQSTTWSTLCEGQMVFGPPPNTVKLHILEWPFIVASLRNTCAIIMLLSNQHLDMPHLWGGWIISAKEKCSLTQI